MKSDAPFNVTLLDVNKFVKENRVQDVSSLSLREPSSRSFAADGLFSESIFGPMGSTQRLVTFGKIELNTAILQPMIYKNLLRLNGLYEDIISGTAYAIFDKTTNNFVRCIDASQDDAGTGFSFFMSHFDELEFKRNDSIIRSDRIDLIEKYREVAFCSQFLVLPAGLRDLTEEQGALSTDDINKIYQTLLSYSFSIPKGATSSIYDGVRYFIQKKAIELYDYIENILTGKRGFIRGVWGRRKIALGTRNVISAASYSTMTPDDPQALKPDETKIGIFQCMKAAEPAVVHNVRTKFFAPVLGHDSTTVALTNPKTYELEYVELSSEELNRYDSPEAISEWISKFVNVDIRFKPVALRDSNGSEHYLCMVYDTGTTISLFRSLSEFEKASGGKSLDRSKIRPLTWAEMFYMATYAASINRHLFITRYPVIQDESCYPTKIHLCSTNPARIVKLIHTLEDETVLLQYPQYPIIGNSFVDSTVVGSARLMGLGGD